MLARLWWKEYRVFGPVWLILVLAAGLLQWLFLSTSDPGWRSGSLTVAGLAWAVLYAFAAGAAAFAGERESKTLGFLDALPVGRWTLWMGKASFALISTTGLALFLAGMAATGTVSRDPREAYAYDEIARVFGTFLFEAVAWSLLWSSLSKNPLLAGVMGVLSVYGSAVLADLFFYPTHLLASNDFVAVDVVPARLLAALGALVVSGLVMAWKPSALASSRAGRPEPEPVTIAIRASSTGRSLVWQARREGWTTWVLVAFVGLGLPVPTAMMANSVDPGVLVVLAVVVTLVAGVSVFGTENISGARGFLVHHGVAPGTVWWRKLLVWGLAMGSIAGLSLFALWWLRFYPLDAVGPDRSVVVLVNWIALANAFAVGLLCGMTITRRMTATLVGVIVLIAVVPIQIALAGNGMVPSWSIFLVPLVFVTATRAWAGDWLLEREGARPWLRLGAWLAVPLGVLAAAYVGYRAYGVPDVGPQFVAANFRGSVVPPGQYTAEAYSRAAALIGSGQNLFIADRGTRSPEVDAVIENGWDPALAEVVAYWKNNQPAIDRARKASAMPPGRFEDEERMTITSTLSGTMERTLVGVAALGQLLALDARERLPRGDLSGAWDDILAQFRMAGQLGANSPTLARMSLATRVHHQAVGLAFDWLGAPGQAPETLRRALADLKSLPPLPNLAATMQVEASIIERSLDLPGDELAELLYVSQTSRDRSNLGRLWFARVEAAPWERQRTRRVCRLLIARQLPDVALEPYQRGLNPDLRSLHASDYWEHGLNLTRLLLPYFKSYTDSLDREVVGRRALEQVVAIEVWKLEHEGKYPETLEALVPGLLGQLPLDPYSGRPFRYVRSDGRPVRTPILPEPDQANRRRPTRPGQPLIYSVGPDRRDDGGQGFDRAGSLPVDDLTYPIP